MQQQQSEPRCLSLILGGPVLDAGFLAAPLTALPSCRRSGLGSCSHSHRKREDLTRERFRLSGKRRGSLGARGKIGTGHPSLSSHPPPTLSPLELLWCHYYSRVI